MRSASTTASSVASKSTGPSSPLLALAGASALRPFSAGFGLGRTGARAPGRSRVKRSFSSAELMLGTGYLRLAFQVVGGNLRRNTAGFMRRFQLNRVVHNWEMARQFGVLDFT